MTTPIPRKEQLTAAAAGAFVLSVGVVSTFPSDGSHTLLVLTGIAFVVLYVTS